MKFSKLVLVIRGDSFQIDGPDLDLTPDFLRMVSDFLKALSPATDAGTAEVLAELKALKEATLNQSEKIAGLAERLNAATNEIASDLKSLRDKIAEGTVTDADLAPLDMRIAQLETLGKDPEDPIPAPVA